MGEDEPTLITITNGKNLRVMNVHGPLVLSLVQFLTHMHKEARPIYLSRCRQQRQTVVLSDVIRNVLYVLKLASEIDSQRRHGGRAPGKWDPFLLVFRPQPFMEAPALLEYPGLSSEPRSLSVFSRSAQRVLLFTTIYSLDDVIQAPSFHFHH